MQSSVSPQPFELRKPMLPAIAIMSLKHLSMQTPVPRIAPLHLTGAPETNAAGTHLLPALHVSALVWRRCFSGTAVSEMQTPLLLRFVVQPVSTGFAAPASVAPPEPAA